MPILGALMAALSRLVMMRLGFWVVSAMTTLGLTWATQELLVEPALDAVMAQFAGLPGDLVGWLRYLQVDKFILTVISAYSAAATYSALRLRRKAV